MMMMIRQIPMFDWQSEIQLMFGMLLGFVLYQI